MNIKITSIPGKPQASAAKPKGITITKLGTPQPSSSLGDVLTQGIRASYGAPMGDAIFSPSQHPLMKLKDFITGGAKGFSQGISSALDTSSQAMSDAVTRGAKNINEASGIVNKAAAAGQAGFQTAGAVAGGAISGLMAPISGLGGAIGTLIPKEVANSAPVNALFDSLNKVTSAWQDFAKAHPDLAANAESTFNIATLLAGGEGNKPLSVSEGAGQLKGDLSSLFDTAKGAAKNVASGVKTMVTPTAPDIQELVDTTSGVADKKARISSLEQTGAIGKNGKPLGGTKQTLLGGIKSEPTPFDIARAESVRGIVKPGASPVENLTNLNKEIARISTDEVRPALREAGKTIPISDQAPGWNSTVKRLADIEKPDIIKADSTLNKTYDLVRQRMIDQIKKQPATVEGLWDARIAFDKVVQDQFGDVAFDSEKNTAIKRAVSDMRKEVNAIIGERVPKYKDLMSKLTNMYDARYNIAEQFQSLVDKGGWKAFKGLNPKKAALLKWGVTGAGYEVLKHTVLPILPGI